MTSPARMVRAVGSWRFQKSFRALTWRTPVASENAHTYTHICVESKPAIHIVQRVNILEDTTYCTLQYIAKSHEIVQLKIKRKK